MGCLNNLIGIKTKDEALAPRSGLFVEDLEGISLSLAADIADEDVQTGLELFKSKIDLAYKLVRDDFKSAMTTAGLFRFNQQLENRNVGKFVDTYLPVDASERGVFIKTAKTRLSRIFINKVVVKVNDNVTDKELKIIDGDVETVYTFSGTAGEEVEIITEYRAERKEVYVVMDNSDVQVNDSERFENNCGCRKANFANFSINGWDGSRTTSKTYGLKVDVIIECDDDDMICMVSHKLSYAIWYKAGIEIMKELVVTDRLNYHSIYGVDDANMKIAEWKEDYIERLENAVRQSAFMLKSVDDDCISCSGNRIKTMHP